MPVQLILQCNNFLSCADRKLVILSVEKSCRLNLIRLPSLQKLQNLYNKGLMQKFARIVKLQN